LTHGFEITFYVLAGLVVAAAVLASALIESKPPVAQEEAVEAELALEAA
jgi:hypothetical protein